MEERQLLRDVQQAEQQVQVQHLSPGPPPPPPSSSSAESSPSHDFSFTVSLHSTHCSKSSPPSKPLTASVDLSPADEIFFHGHLLPLHLSHLSRVSPRSSEDRSRRVEDNIDTAAATDHNSSSNGHVFKGRKSKSLSPFKIPSKIWRKEQSKPNPQGDDVSNNYDNHRPRTSKFDAMKRFLKSIKPKPGFLSLIRRGNRNEFLIQEQQQHYSSYSENLRMRSRKEPGGAHRRREDQFLSAPATMRNSPTNSGVLVASGTVSPMAKSDSTMEELQAAIQAAIAHCKKSIAAADKVQVP